MSVETPEVKHSTLSWLDIKPLTVRPRPTRHVHFGRLSKNRALSLTTDVAQRKSRCDPDYRSRRKRSSSFSSSGDYRHYSKRRKPTIEVSSMFLLGGSINDPLNLSSLDDEEEEVNPDLTEPSLPPRRSNTVRVIIPPNINDPLNLDGSPHREESLMEAFRRRRRRSRKRKRRNSEPICEIDENPTPLEEKIDAIKALFDVQTISATQLLPSNNEIEDTVTAKPNSTNTQLTEDSTVNKKLDALPTTIEAVPSARPSFKRQRSKNDKIVSPVVPQMKRYQRYQDHQPHYTQKAVKPPEKFNPKSMQFQYGNYNRYYGYRNPEHSRDPRLEYFNNSWFEGKEVLDIGCNIGHITLSVARDFNPKRVMGIDIDKKLIENAKKNIRHYACQGRPEEIEFPKSMRTIYGSLKSPVNPDGTKSFPHNVIFHHSNYVLENEELLEIVKPEFDVVLCLSITKWIHLNWGDSGLKLFFRRIFCNLKSGGKLILEPQAWQSYHRKRKLTAEEMSKKQSESLVEDELSSQTTTLCSENPTEQVSENAAEEISLLETAASCSENPVNVSSELSSTNNAKSCFKNSVEKLSLNQKANPYFGNTSEETSVIHTKCSCLEIFVEEKLLSNVNTNSSEINAQKNACVSDARKNESERLPECSPPVSVCNKKT